MYRFAAFVMASSLIVACGGGGGGGGGTPSTPTPAMPTPNPTASPTASPSPTPTRSATPSPTPVPTATASPGALTASVSTLTVGEIGPTSFTVNEPGYRGTYTVTSANTGIVTATSPVTSTSDTTTIDLNVVSQGIANVAVKDASGQTVVVSVDVTLIAVTVQGSHRQ
jgi:hypothetical protein